eukprot:scaffold342947_cov42-Prasinocladus_malaysianus.AAC.1
MYVDYPRKHMDILMHTALKLRETLINKISLVYETNLQWYTMMRDSLVMDSKPVRQILFTRKGLRIKHSTRSAICNTCLVNNKSITIYAFPVTFVSPSICRGYNTVCMITILSLLCIRKALFTKALRFEFNDFHFMLLLT